MSEIVIENLSKTYGKKVALKDISFRFEKGKIYGILGKNGAGKTTLMKIICKVLKNEEGKCDIKDSVIGALIEEPTAYADMTASENMHIFLRCIANRNNKKENDIKIKEILNIVGLDDDKTKFKQFSLGMKKRLGIGLAMLSSPDVLVLDEPTSGLDIQGINEMREVFLEYMNKKENMIIISSHDTRDLALLCDELIIIDNGRIIKTIDEFDRDSIKIEEIYLEALK